MNLSLRNFQQFEFLERISDGHIICFVGKVKQNLFDCSCWLSYPARLWSLVGEKYYCACHRTSSKRPLASHKFSTHYGQEHARLSRDQAILIAPVPSFGWVSALSSAITFRTSDAYLARLEDVFVDNLVYAEQWRPFMRVCLRDWKGASFGVCVSWISMLGGSWWRIRHLGLCISHVCYIWSSATQRIWTRSFRLHIFLFFSPSSPRLALISASLLCASLVSSVLLVHRYEPLENATASEAVSSRHQQFHFHRTDHSPLSLLTSIISVLKHTDSGLSHWSFPSQKHFTSGALVSSLPIG